METSYGDLSVHQARQEKIAGLGEFLVLLIEQLFLSKQDLDLFVKQ